MFGYVLVNNQNSVIFLDGDLSFKLRLQKLVHKQIRLRSLDNASTSSGICTDSTDDNESLKATSTKQRKKSGIIFNSSEISHILLPLILIYRSSSDGNEDPINHLSSILGNISFSKIYDNYLILSFADQENYRKDMLQMVERSILSGFGPLITFCNTDLTTVKRPKEMMGQIRAKIGNFRSKPFVDIKRMIFYSSKVERIQNIFLKLCSQLSVFIGNNRSLLISHGDIIATFNSSETASNIMTSVNISDLSNIISNSISGSNKISQFWLRSTIGVIPYYINVISHQILENLTFVSFIESSENILIRYLYLFSKQIDQIRKSTDLNRDLREVRKTVLDIQNLLVDKKTEEQNPTAFLKNPNRTSSFFKSIWMQIEQEIKEINGVEREKPRSESRFSIGSIRSAFSTMSLNSSIFSRVSMSEKTVPHKLDILLSYAKRQTNSLIQELCSVSIQHANKTTLPLFDQFMDKFLKQQQINFISSLEIGGQEDEIQLKKFLQPSEYFLEMYAYRVQFNSLQQEILHISDELKQDLQNILTLQPTKTFSCNVAGKSGTWYTVQYIYIPLETTNKSTNNNQIKTKSDISLTTVFPGCINNNLAEKQSLKMLDIVLQNCTFNL
ncbi:unnamed protein product [Caenorhabditis angaria]|uniref:Uncharacterized protein n=1 Tax=Caenorhabditis angaria TaxID=860376 RepID=A0A9P1NCB3_9PELO|nr:unnamed protein product [Caenorhabditis angaria]